MSVDRIMQHSFVSSTLDARSTVLDLGSNKGAFAFEIIKRFGARCICYEPNPMMFDEIPSTSGLTKHQMAIASSNGPVVLHIDVNPEASSFYQSDHSARSSSLNVCGITLEKVITDVADERIALLKMDIEGAEVEVISATSDAPLLRCDQISIEFHELLGWTRLEDISRIRKRLRSIGFCSIVMSARHYGDVLFINRRALGDVRTRRAWRECQMFRWRRWLSAAGNVAKNEMIPTWGR